jgi:hypothetical protein
MKITCKIENGNKVWRNSKGQIHRIKGPAIEYSNGDKEWLQNGFLHRIDGPAYEGYDGTKIWCQNNLRHRVDGSAVEDIDGYKKWWFEGEQINCSSQEEFERISRL